MQNHTIFNCPMDGHLAKSNERLLLGMGCFWGAERCFWQLEGVVRTAVGYGAGKTINPDYQQVCSGATGHAELVEVIYDPEVITTTELLKSFWENHDPTQGMRQGNDQGSQYRSVVVCFSEKQLQLATKSRDIYQLQLTKDGHNQITTELLSDQKFYLAEEYHQQYLDKNPQGYCGLGGTGTCFKP